MTHTSVPHIPHVAPPPARGPKLVIDCATCAVRDAGVCDDCVVSFIVGREPGDALVIDVAEERALRMLSGAGLVPGLQHKTADG